MEKNRIYSLINIKEMLGSNKEKIEDLMCHNNCKIVYDYIVKNNAKDNNIFIVGGWMWRETPKGINASYHFSIFDGKEFYDTIDGHFLPLFKMNPLYWKKDFVRLSMCSYYVNNGLEKIEKDVAFLYEDIPDFLYYPERFMSHKQETINGILEPTADHLKYVEKCKNNDDLEILNYKKVILDFS